MTLMTDSSRPGAGGGEDGGDAFGDVGVPGPPAGTTGARLREQLADDLWLEELIDRAEEGGVALTGPGGFLPELIKAVLEKGLAAELTDHLGYAHGERAGAANSRNGTTPKTVATEVGDVGLGVPRDRRSTFSPRLVPKGQRRLGGLDDMIISLFAGGMTVRDIQHHLAATLGTELSHETIANITDAVLEEVKAWQSRPLDAFYPIVYVDALVVKVRDGGHVRNKSAHIAVGVGLDGVKRVLGIWVQASEGAKFWAAVCAELANRGVRDILIACCDGLTGLPEAIEATFPHTTVQTCVVHLIRASLRFVSYRDRKALAAALKAIYTAPSVDAAETALLELADDNLGRRNPAAIATWQAAWERFIPFLAFPPEVRRIIYTTNSIESLNYQLRKIIKNRGHFPNDDAVVKLRGSRSATSRTTAPASARRTAVSPPGSAPPPAGSSRATRPRAGPPPWPHSPSPTRPHHPPPEIRCGSYTRDLTSSHPATVEAVRVRLSASGQATPCRRPMA